ncbi:MAG: GNAT family N-acetyltransferase [Chloroflexi bacterium]|nr:GNAT family N-acetyltransferase [Chloroflexota bacterium]
MDDITIRPAREDEAAAYRDLRLEALLNHPEVFSSDYAAYVGKPLSYWSERLRLAGTEGVAMMYFAAHGDELVGMCGIFCGDSPKTQHSATVVSLYVRPTWRGQGLGERLVMACVDWALDQEVKMVKLAVVTTNTPAIRCYACCGFRVYGIEPQALLHDAVYYDELLMMRPT